MSSSPPSASCSLTRCSTPKADPPLHRHPIAAGKLPPRHFHHVKQVRSGQRHHPRPHDNRSHSQYPPASLQVLWMKLLRLDAAPNLPNYAGYKQNNPQRKKYPVHALPPFHLQMGQTRREFYGKMAPARNILFKNTLRVLLFCFCSLRPHLSGQIFPGFTSPATCSRASLSEPNHLHSNLCPPILNSHVTH